MARLGKPTVLLALLAAIVLSTTSTQDVMRLLGDPVSVQRKIDCALKKGPCDEIGTKIQKLLPDVINGDCRNCGLTQKIAAHYMVTFMKQNRQEEWAQIKQMYSTEGSP